MTGPQDWADAERVLCVRLDALGDVLMTTPALRALKAARPGRQITLLTSPAGAEAATLIPSVDDVIVYQAPWMKAAAARVNSRADHAMLEHLRDARFDAAAIFTVYSQNPLPAALMCTLADIPLRLAHCRENPYQLLTHWVPEPEPARLVRHEVRRQLDLVSAVGCPIGDEHMEIEVPADARRRVLGELQRLGINPRSSWVVIHPGATAPSRRYPPEHFARVARRLVLDVDMHVIFTGSAAERPRNRVDPHRDGRPLVLSSRGAESGRARGASRDGSAPDRQQHRTGARRCRGRHACGRSLCPDQSSAHPVGRAQPCAQPRCPLQVLLQEHLPGGAPQLPDPGPARGGRGGCLVAPGRSREASRRILDSPASPGKCESSQQVDRLTQE